MGQRAKLMISTLDLSMEEKVKRKNKSQFNKYITCNSEEEIALNY